MGDEFLLEARHQLPLVDDYEMQSFISELGNRLVETLGSQPFDYEFFVVRADDINAFAVPGGKVFFNAGLIARAGSEDEVAGVMGHEIAHAHAHHIVRQQQKSAGIQYASLLGLLLAVIHPALAIASLSAGQAAALTYQRDFEREADYLGVGYARAAGFKDFAIMQLLRKLYAEQQVNPTLVPPYLLSHPLTGERLTNLEAVLGRREWDESPLLASRRLERVRAVAVGTSQGRAKAVGAYKHRVAVATDETLPAELEYIGVMMTHGEDYIAALPYLERARAAGRTVDRELGRSLLRTGKLEEARPYLERAVAAVPEDWNALADFGVLEYQTGHYGTAVKHLERSLEMYEHRPELLRTLGRALGKDDREGEGFYAFGRAAELEGNRMQAVGYYRRARENVEEGDELHDKTGEKLKELEEGLDERPAMPGRPSPDGRPAPKPR